MEAAIYCRVSTDDQEREGTSLDSQLGACLKKAEELGYEVPQRFIFRESYSGLTLQRPKLAVLRSIAKDGEIAAVICYKPDRLSRMGEDILVLAKEFKSFGIKLILVKDQWDDTPQGKAIAFMLGWASEMYVLQTKEATQRGKREFLKRGILPQGTGVGLYGYKWNSQQKKRIPLEFEADVVKKIFTLIAGGASCFKVAKTLNEQGIPTKTGVKWHPRTINTLVNNKAYLGLTYFGKTKRQNGSLVKQPEADWLLLPDTTPPIISRDLFDEARRSLRHPKTRSGKALHDYLLTGYIVCGYCGSPLVGSCLNKRYRYYYCTGGRATHKRERICQIRYIRAGPLESLVWGKIREVLEHPQVILDELQRQVEGKQGEASNKTTIEKDISKLRRKKANYDYQEKRLISLFRYEEISQDQILDEIVKLKKEREADKQQLSNLEQIKRSQQELRNAEIRLDKCLTTVHQNLDQCTIQTKRLALDALGIKVTVTPNQIDIKGLVPVDLVTIEQTSA